MLICLLYKISRAARENIWLADLRHGLRATYIPVGPTTQSLSLECIYFFIIMKCRTRSIVNVKGVIQLSKSQITLEGNDSLCDVDGAKHKW